MSASDKPPPPLPEPDPEDYLSTERCPICHKMVPELRFIAHLCQCLFLRLPMCGIMPFCLCSECKGVRTHPHDTIVDAKIVSDLVQEPSKKRKLEPTPILDIKAEEPYLTTTFVGSTQFDAKVDASSSSQNHGSSDFLFDCLCFLTKI